MLKKCLLTAYFLLVTTSLQGGQEEQLANDMLAAYQIECQSFTASKIKTLLDAEVFTKYFKEHGTRIFYDQEVSEEELVAVGEQCKNELELFVLNSPEFGKHELHYMMRCTENENMLQLIDWLRWAQLLDWQITRLVKLLILAYAPRHIALIRYVHFALQDPASTQECKEYLKRCDYNPDTIIDYYGTTFLGLAALRNWTDIVEGFLSSKNFDCSQTLLNGENAFGWKPVSMTLWGGSAYSLVLLLQHERVCTHNDQGAASIWSNGYSPRTLALEIKCSQEILQILEQYNL